MKRVKLVVAYDGTAYHGWQIQPGAPTIEGELNRALGTLLNEEIRVIGASRTDAGVHALCNVAVFDTNTCIPAEKIAYALNQRLPEDIRIQASEEVTPDFHPRRCKSRKTYEYRILNTRFPLPTKRLYAHFTYVPLNIERMKQAACYLTGEHDFKSFSSAAAVVESTVRTVHQLTVEKEQDEIIIRVCGNGFLYNMVRIIAGTLMEVGRGSMEPDHIKEILEMGERSAAGPTAPACGLTLVKYEFL
ncbi:MAG: tRNA pseudouridine(38-40) synthase TruA [Lachnospiraceae bacterium]|nr:tRNA pseudouridine(38-40) synthase TruA [Lachnospiraceae bacterium]MDE6185428.1 tRNA pseudouridine(38-40) synthase TruA [Lachnospiraceae bacterium]